MMHNALTDIRGSDLANIFDAFASKAVADFPQLEGRFSIYSEPTGTHHGSFGSQRLETHLLRKQRELAYENKHDPGRPFAVQEDGCFLITYPGTNAECEEIDAKNEHELGHHVAPGGYSDENRCESIAETFALLRRLQKSGTIREAIDISAKITVNNFILAGDTSHFYLPVLQQLDRLSTAYSLSGLTPHHTANFAYRLSFLYVPSDEDIRKLAKIFAPVTSGNKSRMEMADACADIMLEDHGRHSDLVFEMGKIFLQPILYIRPDLQLRIEEHERQKAPPSLEQRLEREVKDLMVLGRFDKDPGEAIDPRAYESMKHLRYLQRAADVYGAIRYFQETGKEIPEEYIRPVSIPAVARLQGLDIVNAGQRRAVLIARNIAADPKLKTPKSRHAP